MKQEFNPSILLPGDVLLYRPPLLKDGLFSFLIGAVIAIKTFTRVSHVEVYAGVYQPEGHTSVASRDGIGVDAYRLRTKGLGFVLRVKPEIQKATQFSLEKGTHYFARVRGQKYDWKGLLCFTLAVHQGATDMQFCSEFATNLLEAGGCKPVADHWEADRTAPAQFLQSTMFNLIWKDGGLE